MLVKEHYSDSITLKNESKTIEIFEHGSRPYLTRIAYDKERDGNRLLSLDINIPEATIDLSLRTSVLTRFCYQNEDINKLLSTFLTRLYNHDILDNEEIKMLVILDTYRDYNIVTEHFIDALLAGKDHGMAGHLRVPTSIKEHHYKYIRLMANADFCINKLESFIMLVSGDRFVFIQERWNRIETFTVTYDNEVLYSRDCKIFKPVSELVSGVITNPDDYIDLPADKYFMANLRQLIMSEVNGSNFKWHNIINTPCTFGDLIRCILDIKGNRYKDKLLMLFDNIVMLYKAVDVLTKI